MKEKYTFGLFTTKKDILEIKLKGITNITNASCMFYKCSSLSSLPDISKWNTSNVTNMSCMFYDCFSLLSFLIYLNGILLMLLIWLVCFMLVMIHLIFLLNSKNKKIKV